MSEILTEGDNDGLAENPQPEADAGIVSDDVALPQDSAEGDVLSVQAEQAYSNAQIEDNDVDPLGQPEDIENNVNINLEAESQDHDFHSQDSQFGNESESAESEMGSVAEQRNDTPSDDVLPVQISHNEPSTVPAAVTKTPTSDQAPECDQPFGTVASPETEAINNIVAPVVDENSGNESSSLSVNINQENDEDQTVSNEAAAVPAASNCDNVDNNMNRNDSDCRSGCGNEVSERDFSEQNVSSSLGSSLSSQPESLENNDQTSPTLTSANKNIKVSGNTNGQSTSLAEVKSPSGVKQNGKSFPISRKSPPGIDFLHLSDSSEDELMNELDEALLSQSHSYKDTQHAAPSNSSVNQVSNSTRSLTSSSNGLKQLNLKDSAMVQKVEQNIEALNKKLHSKEEEIKAMGKLTQSLQDKITSLEHEKQTLENELKKLKEQDVDNLYLPQIKELEKTIAAQQKEIQETKETLSSHDALAKRKITAMQSDFKLRIDQVTKMYEDCLREKDNMVVNYAVAEQKNIECKKATEKVEAKLRDQMREQENVMAKMKAMKLEKQKMAAEVESKLNELSASHKEIERMKEVLTSADVRIKWAQNKLKAELEAHKETKIELEKTSHKLKMAKEETMQIRKDCQAIVKQYQESEEIKSNSLDKELKLKESELIVQRQEKTDSQEVYNMTVKELDSLKAKHKDAIEELKTLRDKVYCLENERKQNEETMTKYQDIIQKQKGENKTCHDKLGSFDQLQEDFNRAQDMIKNLDREISELRITNKDLQLDIEGCRTRESELLELTQKLSRTNAKLQSENTNSNNQVVSLSSKLGNAEMEVQSLEEKCQDLALRLGEEEKKYATECVSLKTDLAEATKKVAELKQKLEDEKDLNKTLKRKHANNIKDLTRQLQQAKKKLDHSESHGEKDGTSLGSRTSSNGSLNTMADGNTQPQNNHHHHQSALPVKPAEPEYPVITEQVEVDKQVLIERIVRLQKAHARKNEKLEFLQDHIHQLVDEVQKKKKIIQSYILREEQGALAPEAMDENKALLARKGGIMASLYSSQPQDGHMTLDLSLEINQKLQGVLEDTLLKNITLKESIDTLGQEIARLSKENRQLQLHLQGH